MDNEFVPVGPDDVLQFACGPQVPCFNQCCRDLNQFLTPYDIVRLKNHFGISYMELLERYTAQHVGPETGLPVVRLRQDPAQESICPFVTSRGCAVYENRPSSCRLYPVARAISRNRETGVITEHFAVLKESHCRGFENVGQLTVRQWIENQGLVVYNRMNDLLMEIISFKNQCAPGPLDFKSARAFHMACYDLDSFREKIFDKGDFQSSDFDDAFLQKAKGDDAALLEISLGWLKKMLFGDIVGSAHRE